MPELPEVETIARDLRPLVVGRRVTLVTLTRPSVVRFPGPDQFVHSLSGADVTSLRRRGKFLHFVLDMGEDLVVHLGMTGSLTLTNPEAEVSAHTHLRLLLSGGSELRYRDPRRFGRVLLGRSDQLRELGKLPRLGPEPLSRNFAFGPAAESLRRSSRAVKSALLDQAVIAGCGNIYADEACFISRVRPARRASDLSDQERLRLLLAIPLVMRAAIRKRGSSISDYRDGLGAKGGAHHWLFAYGRGGLPCARCGDPLRLVRVGGRATVYCERCQV